MSWSGVVWIAETAIVAALWWDLFRRIDRRIDDLEAAVFEDEDEDQ